MFRRQMLTWYSIGNVEFANFLFELPTMLWPRDADRRQVLGRHSGNRRHIVARIDEKRKVLLKV